MRVWGVLTIAATSFALARGARVIASESQEDVSPEPYAPTPASAPFISLGYREAVADLMFVRLRGYFGEEGASPDGVAALCDAMLELDPRFQRGYGFCANSLTFFALTPKRPEQAIYLRAIALLERGMREFPKDWRLPNLAGQIYTQDLQTQDPKQRREWDEKGTLLVESAVRKPGAPAEFQVWAAVMRSRLGQQDRAVQGLREMLLLTNDVAAKQRMITQLATLEQRNADAIAGELNEAATRFRTEWELERPSIPATWYVILGKRLSNSFDLVELATGGRDLISAQPIEELKPVE